ncbi:glycoprotein Xg isoform X2 [Elephas maximus indicus]|uniref:glycoprotein Xg isoform X2 n=1 Tax=Elephas maximus indicus TaxID=99487 RepID=UPI002115DBF1|nr:glycoprotein Xg isoform X2 [Elephas maximus indicus]
MASRRGVPWLLLLGVLIHAGRGQRDFDLADALDDPEPTRKPSSDIYPKPKPPPQPQPGYPDSGGRYFDNIDHNDGRYPPRPQPPAGGGGRNPNYDSYGNTHGGGHRPNSHYGNVYGGDGPSTYGNPEGNTVARIVSPIVSVVVVALVGAATSYFTYNRRRNCFRSNEPENV